MKVTITPLIDREKDRPYLIAGPCSAETEKQVLETAVQLAKQNIHLFRAGIWKPRTRPNSFEGVGKIGLKWLKKVKQETGLKVTTEVANKEHVFEALKHEIDVLWLGARTTVNPFSVQEIADALDGVDIPVFIKNPINADLALWIGAIERIYAAGIKKIGVIHRGFSSPGNKMYRNPPMWNIPIDLKAKFPDLTIICDNSHICGRRDTLQKVAQKALDLNYDGLMTEVHPTPDDAWSDAMQQITPTTYGELIKNLKIRNENFQNLNFISDIKDLRHEIDIIDSELVEILGKRMQLAEVIGKNKKVNNIAILQPIRWSKILAKAMEEGQKKGLSEKFIIAVFNAIHHESIKRQADVLKDKNDLDD